MTTPFVFLDSIIEKKQYLDDLSEYSPFVVNKGLSLFLDTIMYANDMNMYPEISNHMHYDYLYHAIRKGKRYSKWPKKLEPDENVKLLSEIYEINISEAEIYVDILGPEKVALIIKNNEKGGYER